LESTNAFIENDLGRCGEAATQIISNECIWIFGNRTQPFSHRQGDLAPISVLLEMGVNMSQRTTS